MELLDDGGFLGGGAEDVLPGLGLGLASPGLLRAAVGANLLCVERY